MKTLIYTFIIINLAIAGLNAQPTPQANSFLPFHQILKDNAGKIQQHVNSQAVVYRKISGRYDDWDNLKSAWVMSDSDFFGYNANAIQTHAQHF